jgi:enediyne biosynthesis protein E4
MICFKKTIILSSKKHTLSYLLGIVWLISACQKKDTYQPPADPLFEEMDANETGIRFKNELTPTDSFNVITYRNFYNGGGVALGDVNNDGLNDVFLTSNSGQNKLYLNRGDWKFDEQVLPSTRRWHTGATMADVNNDGWLDIYVCNSGTLPRDDRANELYINQKNGTFKEQGKAYGLADKGMSTHAAFFDFDLDGDLDCYVMNNGNKLYVKFDFSRDTRSQRDPVNGQRLYRNDGGHFTDVSTAAGIFGSEMGMGLGINIGDMNGDKYPDIYIANDLFERDYLYLNQKNGEFLENLPNAMGHISINSMGGDLADINNDGLNDLFATDMLPEEDYRLKTNIKFDEYDVSILKNKQTYHYQYLKNMLQLNNGDGTFSEIASLAGVDATDWSWGALIFDFENDGWKDIFVSNGMPKDINDLDYIEFVKDQANVEKIIKKKGKFDFKDFIDLLPSKPIPSYAFVNQRNLTFKNAAYEMGLGRPNFNNGSAYGDLDNDGDMDLVVNNLNGMAGVYRNEADKRFAHNYLKIKLEGPAANRFGVGAEVQIWAQEQTQVMHLMPARGFQSCVPHEMVFGLGKTDQIDSLQIIWPNLKTQKIYNLQVNQTLVLKQQEATQPYKPQKITQEPLLTDITKAVISGNYAHRENLGFVDFNRERLLPRMLSTEGPRIAVGDLTGDGQDDFWIAGAKDDPGKVFVFTASGNLRPIPQPDLLEDQYFEDADGAIFDVDGDKDNDLVVASGGYENPNMGVVRVYLNDGRGHLKGSPEKSPKILVNAACIRPCDFDKDGDMDLFVGGRAVPGQYGATPRSFLLANNGGEWIDVSPEALQQVGLVTDATWADYDRNGQTDLVVVGEWMPVSFFKNSNGLLDIDNEKVMPNSNGWYTRIKATDLDQDGDLDFVVGNVGKNTRFRANASQPMQAFFHDFDQNEVPECLITTYKSDDKSYLFAMKPDVTGQMPSLKKQFLHYKDFGGKSIEALFPKEIMEKTQQKQTHQLESGILWNTPEKMVWSPLPIEAQVSPILGILHEDLDGDKIADLLLAGNFFGLKPEVGRWDASYGVFMKGKGKGVFSVVPNRKISLKLDGQVRDIVPVQDRLLVARNNAPLQVYRRSYQKPTLWSR